MQELKKLVRIIDTNNSKIIPVIDLTDQVSLEGKLFHIIKADSAQTDGEACLLLYGEEKLIPSYRMLKSRLRKRLLNNLLLIELTESHLKESRIYVSECLTLMQQANKLLILGEFYLADKVANQLIEIAEKAELNDMLSKGYEIKVIADSITHDKSSFEKNLKLMQHYNLLDAKEREAFILYNRLQFQVSYSISNSRKIGNDYQESLLKLKELWESTGSSCIYDSYHLIYIGYCEVSGDYEGILKAINDAEALLAQKVVNKVWFNYRFNNFIKVYACLRLGRLEEGLKYSKMHLSTFKEGSANWFAFLENYLLISLHIKDYNLAVQLCTTAVEKGILEIDRVNIRERWTLFMRYLQLLVHNKQTIEFDLQLKEIEEVILLSKDKEGLNLPLIILEYLERLSNLDVEDNLQYAERFSKYATKYLKGEIWARARLFIKLLLLSMKEEGEKLAEKAAPLLQKLKSTPPPRDPIADVEIVPYEHLWELVLTNLNDKAKL